MFVFVVFCYHKLVNKDLYKSERDSYSRFDVIRRACDRLTDGQNRNTYSAGRACVDKNRSISCILEVRYVGR